MYLRQHSNRPQITQTAHMCTHTHDTHTHTRTHAHTHAHTQKTHRHTHTHTHRHTQTHTHMDTHTLVLLVHSRCLDQVSSLQLGPHKRHIKVTQGGHLPLTLHLWVRAGQGSRQLVGRLGEDAPHKPLCGFLSTSTRMSWGQEQANSMVIEQAALLKLVNSMVIGLTKWLINSMVIGLIKWLINSMLLT